MVLINKIEFEKQNASKRYNKKKINGNKSKYNRNIKNKIQVDAQGQLEDNQNAYCTVK